MKQLILFTYLLLVAPAAVIAQGTLPFFDNFEEGSLNPDWWTARPNLDGNSGFVSVELNAGLNGTFGVLMGKTNDQNTFTTNALDLAVDLSGQTDVELTFWIADSFDETQLADGLYFSNNGGSTFTKVLDFLPSEWCNFYGQYPPIDVDGLAMSNGLTLNSNFVIRFQQRGLNNFTGGTSNQDGFLIDDISVYDPGLVFAPLPFQDDFETGAAHPAWAWNFADNSTVINTNAGITGPMNFAKVTNGNGLNGTFGLAMGRLCDGVFTTNAMDLHLDLAEETDVVLTFDIADNFDESNLDDGIYFSNDGGISFVKAVSFFPAEWCSGTYSTHPNIDLDNIAAELGLALTNQFVVRFQQHGNDNFDGGTNNEDGFFIDNVRVFDPELEYVTLPFEDTFDDDTFKKAWAWNFADASSTTTTGPAITSPMGIVGVFGSSGINGTPGVAMGSECDNVLITNALDLHLDLSEEEEVELLFWISDNFDNNDLDDGLYFSDNGGETFEKVFDFLPEEWCNLYGRMPPVDVDELAAAAGLDLTNQFVIRFQQRGDDNFTGGTNNQDGFLIDQVNVYVPAQEYATLPFEDGFELGVFGPHWSHRFADATASVQVGSAITSPMSYVAVYSGSGHNGSTYAVGIGKICDGVFITNALDLRLDALSSEDVVLSFWLADNFEETQEDDGIYLSVNGGIDFVKIFAFDYEASSNNFYNQYQLNLTELATEADLLLTSTTVVRFQQRGNSDFGGGTNNQDGIVIDDINVSGMTTSVANQQPATNLYTVFPNPAQDFLNISSERNELFDRTSIFSLDGKLILDNRSSSNSANIEVSSLVSGVYILRVVSATGRVQVIKFRKE